LNQLNETLIEICFNYEMNDEVNEILELPTVPNHIETEIAPVGEKKNFSRNNLLFFVFFS